MNWNKINSKVGWMLIAVAGSILLHVSQQHALIVSRANERAADRELVRASLEIAALKSQRPNIWREVVP